MAVMEIRPVNRADLPAIRDLFLRSVQEVAIRDYTPRPMRRLDSGR